MKIVASIAALGLAVVSFGGSASAQVGRFDPALRMVDQMPFTTVQADQGSVLRLRPGGRPGMRPGGPGGPGPGARIGGPGPRFGGGFGPRPGGPGPQFGHDGGQRYGGDYRRHHGGFGVGAGIAAGALLGGAIAAQSAPAYGYGYNPGIDEDDVGYAPPPPSPDSTVYAGGSDDGSECAQRYKSFDPSSGTYLGYDGARHPCP